MAGVGMKMRSDSKQKWERIRYFEEVLNNDNPYRSYTFTTARIIQSNPDKLRVEGIVSLADSITRERMRTGRLEVDFEKQQGEWWEVKSSFMPYDSFWDRLKYVDIF